jgi:hypothetical protein
MKEPASKEVTIEPNEDQYSRVFPVEKKLWEVQ